jgi:hypothetical protein
VSKQQQQQPTTTIAKISIPDFPICRNVSSIPAPDIGIVYKQLKEQNNIPPHTNHSPH